jgi:glycosyltransferase involved in cell wall biosynthesis
MTSSLQVLVVLPRHLDTPLWAQRFARGETPDQTPYGYHFANQHGCEVFFSKPTPDYKNKLLHFIDRAIRKALGFDWRHIWANRRLITCGRFDCLWTHTEYEHLGLGLLRNLKRQPLAPVIAQSIWLIDGWSHFSRLRRALYRWLMQGHEVATFHSVLNTEQAQKLGLAQRVALVRFGIALRDYSPQPTTTPAYNGDRPLRILAMGNDRHRDWDTLVQALGSHPQYDIRIGSSFFPKHLLRSNIQAGPMTQAQVLQNYAWADCVVLPLKANLHVSGSTSTLEAVAMQVPLICTRTGGLDDYFDPSLVHYFAVGQPQALRCAVDTAMAQPLVLRQARTQAARQHLIQQQLTSEGFALRHVQLSRELIA